MSEPSISSAEIVARLWKDASGNGEVRPGSAIPLLAETNRMIHDGDLIYLTSHRDLNLQEVLAHLLPLLSTMAERRDELVGEVRLLREALVAESERLQQRDDLLHRLLEARLDRLETEAGDL
jgi:hypothetical protein